jgi:hypothetical protein
MTIEVIPSAVNSPPTLAPQMWAKISPTPIAIRAKRTTSRKIAGIRRRAAGADPGCYSAVRLHGGRA